MPRGKSTLTVELKAVVGQYQSAMRQAGGATDSVEKGLKNVERAGTGLEPVRVRITRVGLAATGAEPGTKKFGGGLDRLHKGASGVESGMSGVADGISGVSTLMAEGAKAPADMAVAFASLGSAATTTAIPAVKGVGRGLAGLKGLVTGVGKAVDGDLVGGLARGAKGAAGLGTGISTLVTRLGGLKSILVGGGLIAGVGALVLGLKALEEQRAAQEVEEFFDALARGEQVSQAASEKLLLMGAAWGGLGDSMKRAIDTGGPEAGRRLIQLAEDAGAPASAIATLKGEFHELSGTFTDTAGEAEKVEDSIRGVNDALRAQFDPIFAASKAQTDLSGALARQAEVYADAESSAEDKARADAAVMDASVSLQAATNDLNTKVRQGTIDVEQASAEFVDMATRMNIPKAEARRLADQIFGATKRSLELGRQRPTPVLRVKDLASGQINAVRGLIRNFGGTVATATLRLQVIGLQEANRAAALKDSFQHGGVVGGPRGAPRLVLAHGGETVVPTHDSSEMARFFGGQFSGGMAAPMTAPGPIGGGGVTVVQQTFNVHVAGSVLAERDLVRTMNKAASFGRLNARGRTL